MMLTMGVLGMVSAAFIHTARRSFDHALISRANEQARTLLDLMGYDIRMIGAGMPIYQHDFDIEDLALGDASLPILLDATADSISVRLNEHGKQSVLSADFNPTVSSTVTTVAPGKFTVGDTIYISNLTAGGTGGLRATITGIAGNSLTLSDMVYSAATTFSSGSTIDVVNTVTYEAPEFVAVGIQRTVSGSSVVLSPNSTFSLEYLDGAGNALVLPLTRESMANSLSAIRLTISVSSGLPLSNGAEYTATARETLAIRNILLSR